MEFYNYFPSVTFVVLTADQVLGAMMARLNNRSRIATFAKEIAHLLWFQGKISPRYKDDND